jgi:hypothetical protein
MRNEADPEPARPVIRPCRPSVHSVRSSMRIDTLEAPRLPAAHHPLY